MEGKTRQTGLWDISQENTELKYYWYRYESLEVKHDILYHVYKCNKEDIWQVILPQPIRRFVFDQLHCATIGGHLGVRKTLYKIYDNVFIGTNLGGTLRTGVSHATSVLHVKPQ